MRKKREEFEQERLKAEQEVLKQKELLARERLKTEKEALEQQTDTNVLTVYLQFNLLKNRRPLLTIPLRR